MSSQVNRTTDKTRCATIAGLYGLDPLLATNRSTPRALIFDLGKVLIPFDFSLACQALEAVCPYRASEILQRIRGTGLDRELEMGTLEPEAFVEALRAELEMSIPFSQFRAIWNSIFLPDELVPEAILVGLRKRYRLLLLSNTNSMHFESIEQNYPILRHFDEFVLSYRVGMAKPQAGIYHHAAAVAGCPMEECLFIDDLAENVMGAELAGMPAIQFCSLSQLVRDLAARGVVWE